MAKAHLDNRENFRCGVQYEDDVKRKDNNASRTMKDAKGKSTWGTAISFGFHRRTPELSKTTEAAHHPRSASAAPPLDRQQYITEHPPRPHNSPKIHPTVQAMPQHAEPPRMTLRNNWVDVRHQKQKNVNNCNNVSNYNHEQTLTQTDRLPPKQRTILESANKPPTSRIPHSSPVHTNPSYNNNYNNNINNNVSNVGTNRKTSLETAGKYTLHTSHLPLPQYAVRMTNANANTVKPASSIRKYSPGPRGCAASKDDTLALNEARSRDHHSRYSGKSNCATHRNFVNDCTGYNRQVCDKFGKLRLAEGKTFEVRDVDDGRTVTEISVIPLPKSIGGTNLNTNLLRDQKSNTIYSNSSRCVQYGTQKSIPRNDNSHKDSSNSDTIPSLNMDFDTSGFDSPEYGHGEAMADECSSGSDENRRELLEPSISALCQNTKPLYHDYMFSNMHGQRFENKKMASVLLSLEDPAFAAAAATETSMIDDETLPVDFNTSIISNGSIDGNIFRKKPTEQTDEVFANDSYDMTKASSNSFRLTGRKEDAREKSCRQLLFTPKEVHDENNSIRRRILQEANELRGQSKFNNSRVRRDDTETDSITWSSYELYDEDDLPSDSNGHSSIEKRITNHSGVNGLSNGYSPQSALSAMNDDRTVSPISKSPRVTKKINKPKSPRLDPKKTNNVGEDDNWSMEPHAYQNMIQEIFSIKSTLKMLTKILHQETDNFESPVDEPETEPIAATSTRRIPMGNELSDLRRQVVFLQGQLIDKERSIHSLQLLLAKFQRMNNKETQKADSSPLRRNVNTRRTVNATTQTMFSRRFQLD